MKIRDVFVTRDERRGRARVQPLGWVAAALGFLLAASLAFCAWQGASGPELRVTPTPRPASTPSATRTDDGSPTPRPAATSIVPPGDPNRTHLHDDFIAAWTWLFASQEPHDPADVTLYYAPLPEGTNDPAFERGERAWYGLETAEAAVREWADHGLLPQIALEGGAWRVDTLRVLPGGGQAVVEARYEGGVCRVRGIDVATGEVLDEQPSACLWYVGAMVFDEVDTQWKIAGMRQYVQAPDAASSAP